MLQILLEHDLIYNQVVLEDMRNKLSQEADTMLDIINDIPKKYRKELLIGYKTLLQSSIDAVNRMLANPRPKIASFWFWLV